MTRPVVGTSFGGYGANTPGQQKNGQTDTQHLGDEGELVLGR